MENYQLQERIGKGSFGQVYKALYIPKNQIVAIKVIDLEEAVDEIEDIQQEISMIKQLKSTYITKFHDSFIKDAQLWLVMEYCDGGSLIDILKWKPVDEKTAAIIIRDILRGLEYIHGEGKLHRDIKCANILLKQDGSIKICDFGVSGQMSHTLSKRHTFVGSPMWMAPEVIIESGYNEKADIWSLGITCIELVLGQPPYSEEHPMRALFLIPKNDPPVLEGPFSKSFKDFVSLCLQKDFKLRPSAKELLKHKFIKNAKKNNELVDLIKEHRIYCLEKMENAQEDEEDDEDEQFYSLRNHPEPVSQKDINQVKEQDWDFGTIKLKKPSPSNQYVSLFDIPPPPITPKQGWSPLKIINRSFNVLDSTSNDNQSTLDSKLNQESTIRIKSISNSTLVKVPSSSLPSSTLNTTATNTNNTNTATTNTNKTNKVTNKTTEHVMDLVSQSLVPFKSSIPYSKRQALLDAFKSIHQHDKTLVPLIIQELYKTITNPE